MAITGKGFLLTLCVIAKDEEKVIEKCFESVHDIVDEIVLVDTGSSDNTIEIAKKYGANIITVQWENDFSKAKNLALQSAKGDWIIFLDADERLHPEDKEKLINTISSCESKIEAILTPILNYTDLFGSVIGEINYNFRVFRNKEDLRFIYPIHENLWNIKEGRAPIAIVSDVKIIHIGYIPLLYGEKNKNERNLNILKMCLKEKPKDFFHNLNIAVEFYNRGEYEKALEHLLTIRDNFRADSILATRYLRYMVLTYLRLNRFKEAYQLIYDSKRLYEATGCFDFTYLEVLWFYYQGLFKKCIERIENFLDLKKNNEIPSNSKFIHSGTISFDVKEYKLIKAKCYEELGEYRSAFKTYREIIEENKSLYPVLGDILNLIAKAFDINGITSILKNFKLGDFEKSILINAYLDFKKDNDIEVLVNEIEDEELKNYFKNVIYLRKGKLENVNVNFNENLILKIEKEFISYVRDVRLGSKVVDEDIVRSNKWINVLYKLLYSDTWNDLKLAEVKVVLKLLHRFGQDDLIEVIVKRLIQLNDDELKELEIGLYLYEIGLKEIAIEIFVNMVKKNFLDYKVLYYLGKHLYEIEELFDALNLAEAALQLNDSYVPIYKILYEIYRKLGKDEKIDELVDLFCMNFRGLDFYSTIVEN